MANWMIDPTNEERDESRITTPPRPFDDEAADLAEAAGADGDVDADEGDPALDLAEDDSEPVDAEPFEPESFEPEPFEDLSELPTLLEALLFVADHPVDVSYLSRAVDVSVTRVEHALDTLAESLRESKRGIRLQRGPSGVQLVSAPETAAQVERFLGLEANRRLSTAALETLAIIAYRQPITRGQIDAVRGVSSDGAVATLRARELIEPAGHAPGPGRPMLLRTTQRFLEHFGLERPGQLPPLPQDIDLPPTEIGEQLGLDEQAVAEALRPREPEGEAGTSQASAPQAPAEETGGPSEIDGALESAVAASADVEIPSDLHVLSQAAGHAFEASRERLTDAVDPDEPEEEAPASGV